MHLRDKSRCVAGAAATWMKIGRPTVAMRIAFAFGDAKVSDWDEAQRAGCRAFGTKGPK